jgi:hypothetical protein
MSQDAGWVARTALIKLNLNTETNNQRGIDRLHCRVVNLAQSPYESPSIN